MLTREDPSYPLKDRHASSMESDTTDKFWFLYVLYIGAKDWNSNRIKARLLFVLIACAFTRKGVLHPCANDHITAMLYSALQHDFECDIAFI